MKFFLVVSVYFSFLLATIPNHVWDGQLKECANTALGLPMSSELTLEQLQSITSFTCSYAGRIDFDAVQDLTNVEFLKMRGNIFSKTVFYIDAETNETISYETNANIPTWIGNLQSLTSLDLSGNRLKGNIPDEIGTLINLQKLDLSVNKFTKIPTTIGNLSNLKELHLSSCDLVQQIPVELSSLSSLEKLYLQDNRLFGEIPPELGDLMFLKKLRLNQNNLRGSIPVEITDLDLTQPNGLGLHNNCRLVRDFPDCNASDVNDTADCNTLNDSNAVAQWVDSKASLYRGFLGVSQTSGHCNSPAMIPIIMYLLGDTNTTQ